MPGAPGGVTAVARPDARAHLARYLAAGVLNTLVSFVTFHVLLALLRHARGAPAAAQTAATALAMSCSYVLNRGWTFRSRAARGPELARFVASQGVMLVLSSAFLELAIDGFRRPPVPSWLCLTPGMVVLNYLGLRYWVFRAPR